jgi:TolB-like protein
VWFDQNELRGGDAWDQKIRRQIAECALFIPIVSEHTQARGKGYFRLEWKLAVEQSHLMAEGMAFFAPVVVDETPEAGAIVPTEFMRVQWTRLPGGLPTPQFVEQVKHLLDAPHKAARLEPGRQAAVGPPRAAKDRVQPRGAGRSVWTWMAPVVLVVIISFAVLLMRRPGPAAQPAVAEEKPAPSVPAAAPEKSIAVLPFANFSPDKDDEFFADGLHDEVITALAKIHDLKVISRTSVLAYRNPEGRNLKKIAAELGVATVLEGSVQRGGGKVHLNVQLIDARTDDHLWADSYTKDLTDIFAVQSELAAAVTSALKATLSPEERSLIVRRPTENQEAYDLYLRARLADQSLAGLGATREDYQRAIDLYGKAAAKDPSFALPHVQASILHGTMYWFAALDATAERRDKAKAELESARRLAPDAPETVLAQASFDYACGNQWAKSLDELLSAEAGLPNDAQVQYRIAMANRRLGQWPEALDRLQRSVALNPNDATAITQWLGTLYSMRHYAQLREQIGRYRAVLPGLRPLELMDARAKYELDGDKAAFLQAVAESPVAPNDTGGLRAAYDLSILKGDFAAADHTLADPRMKAVLNLDGTISDPVSLHRAFMAYLGGRLDGARRYSEDAIAYYRGRNWAPRQEIWAKLGVARAEAYGGRPDEAIRDGSAALDDELTRDGYSGLAMRDEFGQILVICNRRVQAISVLREIMEHPLIIRTPKCFRLDPVWSLLSGDPQFDQILDSAKPI